MNPIWIKLWKTLMEGWPHGINGVSNIRRIPHRTTEELRAGYKINEKSSKEYEKCHIQVHLSGNNISAVKPPLNHTSPPSMVATFLATRLMAVLQPSGYSVFHSGDTPIQLSLPWRSYFCQCLNTETSTRSNRGFTTETPSISYTISLYIRLVVTL